MRWPPEIEERIAWIRLRAEAGVPLFRQKELIQETLRAILNLRLGLPEQLTNADAGENEQRHPEESERDVQ